MMQRRQHRTEFKVKVTLEAIRGERTGNELAAEYGVNGCWARSGRSVWTS
jgi:transposase-like protein